MLRTKHLTSGELITTAIRADLMRGMSGLCAMLMAICQLHAPILMPGVPIAEPRMPVGQSSAQIPVRLCLCHSLLSPIKA